VRNEPSTLIFTPRLHSKPACLSVISSTFRFQCHEFTAGRHGCVADCVPSAAGDASCHRYPGSAGPDFRPDACIARWPQRTRLPHEGRNVVIEFNWGGRYAQLEAAAADSVRHKVLVIVLRRTRPGAMKVARRFTCGIIVLGSTTHAARPLHRTPTLLPSADVGHTLSTGSLSK
jgi:hypothetical protein